MAVAAELLIEFEGSRSTLHHTPANWNEGAGG